MKRAVIALIAAIVCIAVGLVILMLFLISNGGNDIIIKSINNVKSTTNMELIDTQTLSLENIDMINIKYYSDDIIFYAGDSNELVIKEYKNYTPKKNQVTKVLTKDNKITIEGYKLITNGIIINRNSRVEVYLPLEYAGTLSVSTSSGDLNSDIAFHVTQFNASCSSGDIVLNEVTAENINLSDSSGDITLRKAEGKLNVSVTSGDVDVMTLNGEGSLDSSSGDIDLTLSELTGDIRVVASSGDVMLKLPDSIGFNFEADASSGDIRTFFDDKLDYNDRKNHASGKTGDNAKFKINLQVSSGDINVKRN